MVNEIFLPVSERLKAVIEKFAPMPAEFEQARLFLGVRGQAAILLRIGWLQQGPTRCTGVRSDLELSQADD